VKNKQQFLNLRERMQIKKAARLHKSKIKNGINFLWLLFRFDSTQISQNALFAVAVEN